MSNALKKIGKFSKDRFIISTLILKGKSFLFGYMAVKNFKMLIDYEFDRMLHYKLEGIYKALFRRN